MLFLFAMDADSLLERLHFVKLLLLRLLKCCVQVELNM